MKDFSKQLKLVNEMKTEVYRFLADDLAVIDKNKILSREELLVSMATALLDGLCNFVLETADDICSTNHVQITIRAMLCRIIEEIDKRKMSDKEMEFSREVNNIIGIITNRGDKTCH